MKKDLKHYLSLEYPIRIEADPEGGFVASIPDLPGCCGAGETKLEALEDVEDSKELWLESYYETHGEAPEPRKTENYSGKLLLRIPKSLHQELAENAEFEGVSLNQYLVMLLAERNVARRRTVERSAEDLRNLPRISPLCLKTVGESTQAWLHFLRPVVGSAFGRELRWRTKKSTWLPRFDIPREANIDFIIVTTEGGARDHGRA